MNRWHAALQPTESLICRIDQTLALPMRMWRIKPPGVLTSSLGQAPSDQTLVKAGSVLRLYAQALRGIGRERAAGLLEEALKADGLPVARSSSDEITLATLAGRRSLTKQILSIFSIDELRSEIERRTAQGEPDTDGDDDADDAAFHRELAEDLRTEQWPL